MPGDATAIWHSWLRPCGAHSDLALVVEVRRGGGGGGGGGAGGGAGGGGGQL